MIGLFSSFGSLDLAYLFLPKNSRSLACWGLTIALRVFTLREFVVRRQLHQSQSSLAGLYEGNPKRATNRPTAEKMLRAFNNITLYIHREDSREISALNFVQQQILRLMNIEESIYTTDYLASG
jgi:transposase